MMTSHRNIILSRLAILAVCAVAVGGQTRKQTEPAEPKSLPTLSAQEIFRRVEIRTQIQWKALSGGTDEGTVKAGAPCAARCNEGKLEVAI